MQHRKSINIIGWVLALSTTALYTYTMYPTLSFWDSGEFISAAAGLQICHPPGAPLYQLIGALSASLFGFDNPIFITRCVSFISPLSMGLSVMFLFWILVRMLNRFSAMQPGNIIASVIGTLCFAFADSIWFSATEAEVYALAMLLSLIVFWLSLKWDETSKRSYLLLGIFVLGLALCVHQLSLLVLPAAIVVLYFHRRKTSYWGLLLFALLGGGIVALLVFFVLPALLKLLAAAGATAVVIYALLTVAGLVLARKKGGSGLEFALLGLLFFLIGLSPYAIVPIRSSANPPMNNYNPKDCTSLISYVNRENYTKAPLLYGQYYTAIPPERFELTPSGPKPVFAKELKTVFPRMWNYESEASENAYIEWTGQAQNTVTVDGQQRAKPSFAQNMRFFFAYQVNYMYFRYLLWNFCGRTNDVQGYGDYKNSQWVTGIKPVDSFLNVSTEELNPQAAKGRNIYWAIPLLLCIFGSFYQVAKDPKHFTVNATLFVYNSLALVLFLNQSAYQPRERDYVFLLSFVSMSMWLAVGVLGISQIIVNMVRLRYPRYVAPAFIAVPLLMLWQNFDDHNHHGQYTASNFAISMLNSCERNAILFTNGDNDTFPLWWAQNVGGVRRDVRVINLQLLNSDEQIAQLAVRQYVSAPIKTNIPPDAYKGNFFYSQIYPSFDTVELSKAVKDLSLPQQGELFFGMKVNHFNTNRFFLVKGTDTITWKYDRLDLSRSSLAALDIIAANINSRPIYFSSYSVEDFFGLDNYLRLEGFAYRLSGKKKAKKEIMEQKAGIIDENKMYANFVHAFRWQNFKKSGVYYNEIERDMVGQYFQASIALAYKLFQTNQKEKAVFVCNTLERNFPTDKHYYPLAWADVAMLYSLSGESNKAEAHIQYAVREFEKRCNQYFSLSERQQSQERIEVFTLINQWLRLIEQAEESNSEQIRIPLADKYFTVVNPYLQITFRQLERMLQKPEVYQNEIEHTLQQIDRIYAMAQEYEEPICELPSFLQ